VEPEVFEVLPDVCFGVVTARGVDNSAPVDGIRRLLESNVEFLRTRFSSAKVKEAEELLPYREAMRRVGINPNKFPSSIEALAGRIAKGGSPPFINNAVALANAVSLQYLLPMGAHDVQALEDDMTVRFSAPGDVFVPFGTDREERLDRGELVYAVGLRVKTRRWIWRQSEVGKVTDRSAHVFFPIDGFKRLNLDRISAASDDLASRLQEHLACEVRTGLVDRKNPVFPL
jgi:DNA/RNA-binding domain of Phe-tRNA-synthetase-like protein